MPPKSNRGKNVVGSSSSASISALSFLHPDCVSDFEKFCKNRIVVKEHVFDPATAVTLHIPEIVTLMEHQKIDNFLKVKTYYNEDLIRIFYVGLEKRRGATFWFRMGSISYHVMESFIWFLNFSSRHSCH